MAEKHRRGAKWKLVTKHSSLWDTSNTCFWVCSFCFPFFPCFASYTLSFFSWVQSPPLPMIVWVFKKSTTAKEAIYIYIRIIAYSLLIDELKPQCLAPSFFPVLCTEAPGTSEKPIFLKNLCQTWFSFSLSPSPLVMERVFHQLLGGSGGQK